MNYLSDQVWQTQRAAKVLKLGEGGERKHTSSITNWFQISAWHTINAKNQLYLRIFVYELKHNLNAICRHQTANNIAVNNFQRHMSRHIYYYFYSFFFFNISECENHSTLAVKWHSFSRCGERRENILVVNYACVLCSRSDCIRIQTERWGEKNVELTCFAKVPDSWHILSQIHTINEATLATAATAPFSTGFSIFKLVWGRRQIPSANKNSKIINIVGSLIRNIINNSDRN